MGPSADKVGAKWGANADQVGPSEPSGGQVEAKGYQVRAKWDQVGTAWEQVTSGDHMGPHEIWADGVPQISCFFNGLKDKKEGK